MSRRNVMVMSAPRAKAMAQLEAGYTLHRYDEATDKAAFLAEHGPQCEAIVTSGHVALGAEHLAHLPKLGVVACYSAGFESIDAAALHARGIGFSNSSDALMDDVADVAVMLTLAARRQLVAGHDYVRTGAWAREGMYPLLSSIRGKRAGIVGLGKIGAAIARRFEPMGLEIAYMTRNPRPVSYPHFKDPVALADWADILVVVVPGGPATLALISGAVIDALGPTGTLVNVARGSVVDEPALIAALKDGRLGSAGLDVFASEPDPDPALTALPNVTLYPHHASGTVETRDAMSQTVVDNLAAHFEGRPLPNAVLP